MSASFEKTTSNNFQIGSTHTVLEWLDALASGACDPETFLTIVIDLIKRAPDTSWEVLSLLDQNYRRGKIKPELFQRLKARLQSVALGGNGTEGSVAALPLVEPAVVPAPSVAGARAHSAQDAALAAEAPNSNTDRVAARRRDSAPSRKRFYMGDLLRGRYRLARVISQGSGASMFETSDEFFLDLPDPGRRVALKMLSPSITTDLSAYGNVRREFQRLQALSHPNVLRVHEFDRDGDSAFFTMELLSGASLRRIMRAREQTALAKAHAFSITRAVGDVLSFAIASGVSHGLISLRNIFITDDGDLRILDFGTAETLDGQNPNLLDDPYALACVAYTLLSGKHPYQNRPAVEARADGLQPVRPGGLSGRQWRALRAGLSLERSDRPSCVTEWLYRLDPRRAVDRLPTLSELERGDAPPQRVRLLPYVAAACIALFIALGAGIYLYPATAADLLRRTTEGAGTAISAVSTFVSEKSAALRSDVPTSPQTSDEIVPSAAAPLEPTSLPAPAHSMPKTAPLRPIPVAPVTAPTVPQVISAPPPTPPTDDAAGVPVAQTQVPNAPAHAEGGIARIEFVTDTTEVVSTEPSVHIVVRRKGNLHGDISFVWWTESGTAKPGTDFSPVTAHAAQFESGKDKVSLLVPIVTDAHRRTSKNFYVVIDEPGPGAALGSRTLSMVSIVPPEVD